MSLKDQFLKRTASRSISLTSQGSVELDTAKLLDLITSDNPGNQDKEIKITKRGLTRLSSGLNLTPNEIDIIFSALDSDDDGVITSSQLRDKIESGAGHVTFERDPDSTYVVPELSDDLGLLGSDKCQEQVCELYQQLHHAGNPELLETFESVILGVLRDLKQQQLDKERLEKSYKREKDQHEHHMRQMEEEMELQMQRVEDRVRKREHEKTESEKAEKQAKVEEEITRLQENLKRLQQEGPEARNKEIEDQLLQLKSKVEEMTFANRQLQSELTDAQTNLVLMKGDFAAMKQQLNEKAHELEMEKDTVTEYIREQENLTRQLHLLHDANKRLHDTNDDLREAIEKVRRASPMRQHSVGSNASTVRTLPVVDRRGSLMSEYFQSTPSIRSRMNSQTSLVEEPMHHGVSTQLYSQPGVPRIIHPQLTHQDTCESDAGVVEDIDSGHSTIREGNENDLDDAFLNDAETMNRVLSEKRRRSNQQPLVEDLESHDEVETESEAPYDNLDGRLSLSKTGLDQKRMGSASSRSSSSRSSRSREGRDSSLGRMPRRQSTLVQDNTPKISKVPERMFKVVLAGDAAVGKSSLIMRLCKGKFVSNLSSTLGVDFQTKLLEVDGRTIALQLWDTAGQERFRSIAKSYFRRADGVLLLYDCTYERSFLSMRDWMELIESTQEGSIKKLPIMVCGNKTDMKPEAEAQGRKIIQHEEGQRLSRDYGALFIETSAKEASNVLECVTELTRLMRANEDLEVKTCGLQLHDKGSEKNKGCCGYGT